MKLSLLRSYRKRRASSALIIVLLAVVLATVMILAILTGAQIERQTAYYYEQRVSADALAQAGLQQAVALLKSSMGTTNQFWFTGPGQMMTETYSTTAPYLTFGLAIALSSGTNTAVPTGAWAPPNLNVESIDGTYPLAGDQSVMNVRWIYVRQNGTLDNSDTPSTSAGQSPIIGRYAYWIDDSSSRVNLDTAWSRADSTNNLGDISRIDLTTLPGFTSTIANDTHFYATNNPFNSDYDLRTNELMSAVSSNRFAYTVYNHSSDGVNPFGKPKIYLTTQPSYLPAGFASIYGGYTNYFINILSNTPSGYVDPGIATNLDDTKVARVVNNLYSYLTNTSWPEYSGTSFAGKYYGNNTDPRIFQLAVNIVEYVRAEESQQKVISAIRGYVSGGTFTSQTANPSSSQAAFPNTSMPIIGATRTPYITELTTYWTPVSGAPAYIVLQAEIYLPPNMGIDSLYGSDISFGHQYDYSNNWVACQSDRWFGLSYGGGPDATPPDNDQYYLKAGSSFPLTSANRYAVIFTEKNQGDKNESAANAPADSPFVGKPATTFYLEAALAPGNAVTYFSTVAGSDYWSPSSLAVSKAVGPISVAAGETAPQANSYQIDDPLTGVVATNWQFKPSTWGAANTAIRTDTGSSSPVVTSPTQDVDSSGHVTSVGWRMPYPYLYGQTNSAGTVTNVPNLYGRVQSLAELGYVNTGMLCWTNSDGRNGVPYRTLRLQPSSGTGLPDWALLDLFALPPASTNFLYQPYAWGGSQDTYGGVGGRININGLLYPFTSVSRLTPLMAELTGATNPVAGTTIPSSGSYAYGVNASQLATNIVQMNLSANGHAYAITNGFYTSIGQLAEISGMADSGESSEGNLFEPLAQTTVTGNVFTIYTVGQSLKQLPSGSVNVTGEKRFEATVERNPTIPASNAGNQFRTLVVRELTP